MKPVYKKGAKMRKYDNGGRLSYAEAKKNDPKLDSYIKERKGLKKGSQAYYDVQEKINKAYSPNRRLTQNTKVTEKAPTKSVASESKANQAKAQAAKPKVMAEVKAAPKTKKQIRQGRQVDRKSAREDNRMERKGKRLDKKEFRKGRKSKSSEAPAEKKVVSTTGLRKRQEARTAASRQSVKRDYTTKQEDTRKGKRQVRKADRKTRKSIKDAGFSRRERRAINKAYGAG